jgi:hypothetical protein
MTLLSKSIQKIFNGPNFPLNPKNGDLHSFDDDLYVYNGLSWASIDLDLEPEPKKDVWCKTDVETFAKKHNLDMSYINLIHEMFLPFVVYDSRQPFVSGGYLRRWVQREKFENLTCDIDIYFQGNDGYHRDKFVQYITDTYDATMDKTTRLDNNQYFAKIDGRTMILQCMSPMFDIKPDMNGICEKHLNKFDCFASMILYDHTTRMVYYHADFIEHAKEKVYEFNTKCRLVTPNMQLARIIKFSAAGYKITYDTNKNFLQWVKNNVNKINMNDEPYQQ